ncbi:MAG TPA: hypothetical protein PLY88_06425, partial [Candidatus Omnitrophota bacterium]|nr:hypothetical protein [Candidatus Omnitrophota bacterium]
MGAATANAIEPLGLNTVTGFTQPNGNQFSFAYDLSVATGNNRWAGAALQIDTPRDLNAVGSSLVLSATSSTGNFIVEVHDNSAPTPKVIKLVGSNGKFEITKAALQAAAVTQGVTGFSYEVKQVVFVANAAGDTTGTLVVDTKNIYFISTVLPNPALTAANISHLSGLFNPTAVNAITTQNNATQYDVAFDVSVAASFAAGISPFDDFGTVAKEV